MRECWLKSNQHVYAIALLPALGVLAFGLLLFAVAVGLNISWLLWVGGAIISLGGVCAIWLFFARRIPRLAFENDELLVYLRGLKPLRVPIEHVEVFFHGQGPAMLNSHHDDETVTSNIVVRIADAGKEWHRRSVRTELGSWCDGYIIIRGTWCEPLSMQRLKDLNARLLEVRRQKRVTAEKVEA